jgi:elongation factor P
MYQTNEFRKGLKIEISGEPFLMVEAQFVKPGKGQAFTRCKLKSLISGNVIDRTYKSGEKVPKAPVEEVDMQYLYSDGDDFNFMDLSSYDTIAIAKENLDDTWKWLKESLEVKALLYKGRPISVELPNFVALEITYCEPGVKGDTATGATKLAQLESGAEVQVPLFINQNEKIKIDTRTGQYVERVKS